MRIESLEGRSAVVVRVDSSRRKGALTPIDGENIAEAARMAWTNRLPLVLFMASSGADANAGVAALHGWGTAARELTRCSGVVPVVAIVDGGAVSGSALLIGLADIVVMTKEAYAFVSGPMGVRELTGVRVSNADLGGSATHASSTGVAHIVVEDAAEAEEIAISLITILPDHTDQLAPTLTTADPIDRASANCETILPTSASSGYDIRDIAADIADDGDLLELRSGWAQNIVTALATIGGHTVGFVANQPLAMAGTLDIAASQKAARFVAFCDAFNIAIVTLVDTSGFYPGKDLEWRGMIRHGAQLAFAYARATVPRVAVVIRKSYGGAYIVMDSKTIGNDVYMAWPTAEIAVMGARQAAAILARREDEQGKASFVAEYEQRYLNPYVATERGFVDMVIEPVETRRMVAESLELLRTKRENLPRRRHDNTPL